MTCDDVSNPHRTQNSACCLSRARVKGEAFLCTHIADSMHPRVCPA